MLSGHAGSVAAHYDSGDFYLSGWHPRHIHFGIFEPGERPFHKDGTGAKRLDRDLLHRAVVRMVEQVVAPARIDAGDLVVDAACGVGGTALHLAGTAGCRVIGLNISERQMDMARKLAREDGLEALVQFRFSDCAEEIRLPDRSVDVVVCIEAACHMADRGRFLRECSRILKSGGRLAAQDWLAAPGMPATRYRQQIDPVCESWSMIGLETPDGYVEKLRSAGLEVLEFEDLSKRCLPNARIFAAQEAKMREAFRNETLPDDRVEWMERFGRLSRAWFDGSFRVQRFFARKPA